MPEAPDLQVFAHNLNHLFKGKKLLQLKLANKSQLTNSEAELHEKLEGNTVQSIYRSGKELRFAFANDVLLGMHLMLNGELHLFDDSNNNKNTIAEFYFNNRKSLALTDWQSRANIKLNPQDKKGVDAMSKELDYDYLVTALQRKANIKNILTDQDVIRGIGNAYADEILWEARISPLSVAKAIPAKKIKALADAISSVLQNAVEQIQKAHPDIITGEVRDFLKIHNKTKTESPTGALIKVDKKGARSTYYTDEQELYV